MVIVINPTILTWREVGKDKTHTMHITQAINKQM